MQRLPTHNFGQDRHFPRGAIDRLAKTDQLKHQIQYRPEIDGLRAVAVCAVVLYHAKFVVYGSAIAPGGFIGVDVFFVISGYLITAILLKEMHGGSFSFANFYVRRARRILPALFVVVLTCIPIAWTMMLPKSLTEFAGSSVAALLFSSNFWFLYEDSYVAEPSALKPLLHTWSLSIEEQFYLIFPACLLAISTFARNHISASLSIIFLFSLVLAHFGSVYYADASFFLLPMRAWELMGGAILANLEVTRGRKISQLARKTLPAVGLILVVGAFVWFHDKMHHPSIATLAPVAGTMLLIRYTSPGEIISEVLSSKAFVGLGLISYSLYLWHYPIFAFARIQIENITPLEKSAYILIAALLACTTYFFVEQPFRQKKLISLKTFSTTISASLAFLLCASSYLYLSAGAEHRFSQIEQKLLSGSTYATHSINGVRCYNAELGNHCTDYRSEKGPLLINLGDSHAATLGPFLHNYAKSNGWNFEQISQGGCIFVRGISVLEDNKEQTGCDRDIGQRVFDYLAALPAANIVISYRLPLYFAGTGFLNPSLNKREEIQSYLAVPHEEAQATNSNIESMSQLFEKDIRTLSEKGHRIFIVGSVPEFSINVPRMLKTLLDQVPDSSVEAKLGIFKDTKIEYPLESYLQRTRSTDQFLSSILEKNLAKKIPIFDIFCSKTTSMCSAKDEKSSYFADDDHLNSYGAVLVGERIVEALTRDETAQSK